MQRFVMAVALCWFVTPLQALEPAPAGESPGKRALLIGCTKYPNLEGRWQLGGPANDVTLLRTLLIDKFGFASGDISCLSEEAGGNERRPTRANIEREFQSLIAQSKPGQQIVILLSGHGHQQPDTSNDPKHDPEPDGLDEVFLPTDVGPWSESVQAIENGLVDDDLGKWLQAIRAGGASVWIIFDACHSGTMIRGNDTEKLRRIPPDVLVPQAVLERAQAKSPARSKGAGPSQDESVFGEFGNNAGIVALYAVRPDEVTPELPLPLETTDGADSKTYGLLTFALCEVLAGQQSPLTYRDLPERILARYISWGRHFPVPLAEGTDQDREVLGMREWPRSPILLDARPQGRYEVNVGSLYGLTLDSILAVHPPAGGAEPEKVLGHVKVQRVTLLNAEVVPCEYESQPAPTKLPAGARCDLVYRDAGNFRIRVGVDHCDDEGKAVSPVDGERLDKAVAKLGAGKNPFIAVEPDIARSEWLVRLQEGKPYVVPAAGVSMRGSKGLTASPLDGSRFGPAPDDIPLDTWLLTTLGQIARAQNLLRLTEGDGLLAAASATRVNVRLLRYKDLDSPEFTPVERTSEGLVLHPGDAIGFEIRNPNPFPIDVTLLFVDSGFGIEAYWPEPGTVMNNRIPAKTTIVTPRGEVNAETLGPEYMLVLAVQSSDRPVDFAALAQPTIERARGVRSTRGNGDDVLASPLGKFLAVASYTNEASPGTTRGITRRLTEQCAMCRLSWEVAPKANSSAGTEGPAK